MSIMQLVGDPKSNRWIGRMWWNICVCKLQWQSNDQIVRTEQSNPTKFQSLLNLVNLWSNFKVGSRMTGFDQIRLIREILSGFWVLVSILRFFGFSCFYQFLVLKWQSQRSYVNPLGSFSRFLAVFCK